MYKVEDLTLITGDDILLKKPVVKIRQPSIKEIALIGEGKFFRSLSIFEIDSKPLTDFINSIEERSDEEKAVMVSAITDYDNLLFFMRSSFIGGEQDKFKIVELTKTIFKLMMPEYNFVFNQETGVMLLMAQNEDSHSIVVDREFFGLIKDIARQIFLLDKFFGASEKTEMSAAAQKIADKMAESEKKIRKLKGENEDETSYFARILSIMGMERDLNYLSSLTVYQLNNQFERMNLFISYDQSVKASLAGAQNVEIIDWYKKI